MRITALIVATAAAALSGCGEKPAPTPAQPTNTSTAPSGPQEQTVAKSETNADSNAVTRKAPDGKTYSVVATRTENGVIIEDLRMGSGKEAQADSNLTLYYHGTLESGKKFDGNFGDEPITFNLRQLIEGWQIGIPGMKEGGLRRLTIPPELGYGRSGTPDGTIPPNATLIFFIELKKVG